MCDCLAGRAGGSISLEKMVGGARQGLLHLLSAEDTGTSMASAKYCKDAVSATAAAKSVAGVSFSVVAAMPANSFSAHCHGSSLATGPSVSILQPRNVLASLVHVSPVRECVKKHLVGSVTLARLEE